MPAENTQPPEVPPSLPPSPPRPPEGPRSGKFPWDSDARSYVGCNLALGDLTANLFKVLEKDQRVHANTCVAAAGAIAGFAAQRALFELFPGIKIKSPDEDIDFFNVLRSLTAPDGQPFLLGEPLRQMVFARLADDPLQNGRLWEWASFGAHQAGLSRTKIPDADLMWKNVIESIVNGSDGMPSLSSYHHPHAAPEVLLRYVWPLANRCLTGKLSGATWPGGVIVDPKWWCSITSMLLAHAIQRFKDVLDPKIAFIIAVETAFYTLRIEPARITGPEI